jgi:hypothetical protein
VEIQVCIFTEFCANYKNNNIHEDVKILKVFSAWVFIGTRLQTMYTYNVLKIICLYYTNIHVNVEVQNIQNEFNASLS